MLIISSGMSQTIASNTTNGATIGTVVECPAGPIEIRNSHRWAKCEANMQPCDVSGDGRQGCLCTSGYAVDTNDDCVECCLGKCSDKFVEIHNSHRWAKCEANMHECDASKDGKSGCCCNEGFSANDHDDCVRCCGVDSLTSFTVPKKCLVAMAVGAVGSVFAAPAMLAMAGFTSAGITGGSLAALWQSSMAGVSGGSLFATLQSMAMGGLGTAGTMSLSGSAATGALAFCKGVDSLCNGCIGE